MGFSKAHPDRTFDLLQPCFIRKDSVMADLHAIDQVEQKLRRHLAFLMPGASVGEMQVIRDVEGASLYIVAVNLTAIDDTKRRYFKVQLSTATTPSTIELLNARRVEDFLAKEDIRSSIKTAAKIQFAEDYPGHIPSEFIVSERMSIAGRIRYLVAVHYETNPQIGDDDNTPRAAQAVVYIAAYDGPDKGVDLIDKESLFIE